MLLNGLALLSGSPPKVIATLPKEEDLPLSDRQVSLLGLGESMGG